MRTLAKSAGWIFQNMTVRLMLLICNLVEIFVIIPAASGAVIASRPEHVRNNPVYLLLYMKDPGSALHEEVVELIASTTEYLVVRYSDKVPHPRQGGPTTLPVDPEPDSVQFGPVYFPMLVERESIHMIVPSFDPNVLIAQFRELLSRFPVTTQPDFRIGREGAEVRVWTEYPPAETQPAAKRIDPP